MSIRKPSVAVLLLVLSLLSPHAAESRSGEDPPYRVREEPLPSLENSYLPQVHLMVGRGFASQGAHGGAHLGAAASMAYGNLVGGLQFNRIAEVGAIMGIDTRVPLERYSHAGGYLARRFRNGKAEFTAGLGGGFLTGTRRGDLLHVTEDCKSWAWFSDCPEEDVVMVRTHAAEEVETLSLNPLLSMDVRLGSAAALGFWAQAFLNPEQSLGSFSFFLRFGP